MQSPLFVRITSQSEYCNIRNQGHMQNEPDHAHSRTRQRTEVRQKEGETSVSRRICPKFILMPTGTLENIHPTFAATILWQTWLQFVCKREAVVHQFNVLKQVKRKQLAFSVGPCSLKGGASPLSCGFHLLVKPNGALREELAHVTNCDDGEGSTEERKQHAGYPAPGGYGNDVTVTLNK